MEDEKVLEKLIKKTRRNYKKDIGQSNEIKGSKTPPKVKKYILNARIKQAQKLLRNSDIPITDIALLCGFSNSNYFTTIFKKKTGTSPSSYLIQR